MKDEEQGVRVRTTPIFKLKPREGKSFQIIDLQRQFNFIPDIIIIEAEKDVKHGFTVKAVLTPEVIEREEKELAALERRMGDEIRKGGVKQNGRESGSKSDTGEKEVN